MQSNNKLQSAKLPAIVIKHFMHLLNIYTNTDDFCNNFNDGFSFEGFPKKVDLYFVLLRSHI